MPSIGTPIVVLLVNNINFFDMQIEIYIFILGLVAGAVVVFLFLRKPKAKIKSPAEAGRENLAAFNAERDKKEAEALAKILDFAKTKPQITNDEVQKLLNVSDTSVGRYLDELEKQGKLKQIADTGRGVYYTKP